MRATEAPGERTVCEKLNGCWPDSGTTPRFVAVYGSRFSEVAAAPEVE